MQDMNELFSVTDIKKMSPTVGRIVAYTGEEIPNGWLPCDRRMLQRHIYPELFKVLSTKYGDGDGSNTTFNIPGRISMQENVRYIIFCK